MLFRSTDKINAAMSTGGPELLAQTVGNLVGVRIPYVVTTNFDGFMGMVDGLGGVDVNVTQRNVDQYSGANFEVGPHHMNGTQALAFNRNRHGFPTGDLKRSENQGYFILETLRQLAGQRPGPAATLGLLANLGRHARLVGLGWADAYRLGRLGLSLDPANVRNVLIPVGSGVGTRLAVQPSARDLFADFADDAVLQKTPFGFDVSVWEFFDESLLLPGNPKVVEWESWGVNRVILLMNRTLDTTLIARVGRFLSS